jgi:uncharacterized PurR-regulated membrane protein YhhQ (DUF165 family)
MLNWNIAGWRDGMSILSGASKGTLLAAAISLITAGSQLVSSDFKAGLTCLTVGVVLVIVWAYLIDRQARRAGEEAAEKAVERRMGK